MIIDVILTLRLANTAQSTLQSLIFASSLIVFLIEHARSSLTKLKLLNKTKISFKNIRKRNLYNL